MTSVTSSRTSADTIRSGLYQRVSRLATAADRETARSIEQQNDQNRDSCARRGWTVATEYADPGLSASRFAGAKGGANRAEYRRALADVKAGRIDVLVMWEPSRGSRELEGWAHLLNACRGTGTLLHVTSHDRTYDLANARDWRSLAEDGIDSAYESEKISMRILRGKADGRAAGRPQGGVPYGIKRVWDPDKRQHAWLRDEPDPKTAPVVAEIIRGVAGGRGYQEIASALNARGVPSAAGKAWTRTAVVTVAGREAYAAAGVVTEAESLAARARLADTRRKGERPSAARYRYSEVMTCGRCGGPVRGSARGGAGMYHCRNGCAYIPAVLADEYIDLHAITYLSQPGAAGLIGRADDAAVLAAQADAAKARQKIRDGVASFNAERIGIEQLEGITAHWQPKADAADQRARDAAIPSPLAGLAGEAFGEVAQRWDALSLAARKHAARALMPRITLMPGGHRGAPVSERIIPWPGSSPS